MTKKELKQYGALIREIQADRIKILELRSNAEKVTSIVTDMPHGSGRNDKTGDMAVIIAECSKLLEKKLEQAERLKKRIIEYVGKIDDEQTRLIIRYKYINLLSWRMVAYFMENGYNKHKVRMQANRYIERHK